MMISPGRVRDLVAGPEQGVRARDEARVRAEEIKTVEMTIILWAMIGVTRVREAQKVHEAEEVAGPRAAVEGKRRKKILPFWCKNISFFIQFRSNISIIELLAVGSLYLWTALTYSPGFKRWQSH